MSKKILICDDEQDVALTAKFRLEAAGYKVILAVDGVQSVSSAHKQNPDLILLDINMPAGNGNMVFQTLKKSVLTMNIPIIFFSALPEIHLKEKTKEFGAEGYIAKPYDIKDMISKIKKALGEE